MFRDPNDRSGGEEKKAVVLPVKTVAIAKKLEGSWVLLVTSLQGNPCDGKPQLSGCMDEDKYEVVARTVRKSVDEVRSIFENAALEQKKKALRIGLEKDIKENSKYLSERVCSCLFAIEAKPLNS